ARPFTFPRARPPRRTTPRTPMAANRRKRPCAAPPPRSSAGFRAPSVACEPEADGRFPWFGPVGVAGRRHLEREGAALVGPADRAAEVLAAQGARVAPCRAAGEGRRQDTSASHGAPHGATSGLVRALWGQAEAPRGGGSGLRGGGEDR